MSDNSEETELSLNEGDNCPLCSGTLILRHSSRGDFLGCSNFPLCDFKAYGVARHAVKTLLSIEKKCPVCGSVLEVKKGRFGIFIGCSDYPACHYIVADDKEEEIDCPVCKKGSIVKRRNSRGRAFYACDNFPECKFSLGGRPVIKSCKICSFPLMFEKSGKNGVKEVCGNELCSSRRKRRVRRVDDEVF